MKASELITLLQDAIDKYGDLPILTGDYQFGEQDKVDIEMTPYRRYENVYAVERDNPDFIFLEAY